MSEYANDDFEDFYETEKVLAQHDDRDQQIDYHTFEKESVTHRLTTLSNRKKRASNDVQLLL
jgi:hypothetical protein